MEFATAIAHANELGLTVEMDRDWLWISGDTFPHRETLGALGCRYSGKRKAWYLKPDSKQKSTAKTAKRATKKKSEPKPNFEVRCGTTDSGKTVYFEKGHIFAKDWDDAKRKATRYCNDWAKPEDTDAKRYFAGDVRLASKKRWGTIQKTKKGTEYMVKHLSFMGIGGGFIQLIDRR